MGGYFFGDVMRSERGLFTTKSWEGGGYFIVFVSFEESDFRYLLR